MQTLQNCSGESAFRDAPLSPCVSFMIFEQRLRTDCLGTFIFSPPCFLILLLPTTSSFQLFLFWLCWGFIWLVFESRGSESGWSSSTTVWSSSHSQSDWNGFSSLTSHFLSAFSNILRILACTLNYIPSEWLLFKSLMILDGCKLWPTWMVTWGLSPPEKE